MRFLLSTFLATSLGLATAIAQDTDAPENPRKQISEMIQKGELEGALKLIDATELRSVEAGNFRRQVASAMMRGGNVDGAMEIFAENARRAIDEAQEANELGNVQSDLMLALSVGQRSGKLDEIMSLLDAAMEKLTTIQGEEGQKQQVEFALGSLKMRGLASTGNIDEARAMAVSYVARAREIVAASSGQTSLLVDALMNSANFASDEDTPGLLAEVRSLVTAAIDADPTNSNSVSRYGASMNLILSRMLQSDPDGAEATLAEVRETFAKVKEANAESSPLINNLLGNYERSLDSIEKRLESAKILAKLVGSPAPQLDAKYWVNGQPMEPADLKGKVVLLDFWAVWCGPCIATFPHLREWNEEFGDKGLQIVGVTRKYNYQWNDETERASRTEEPQSDEAELAMLEKFLAHHELKHPTIVTPEDSKMQASYAVTGIPHAVVIDKKGVVRLIKVGSGEANAKAIHDMIVECLAEEG